MPKFVLSTHKPKWDFAEIKMNINVIKSKLVFRIKKSCKMKTFSMWGPVLQSNTRQAYSAVST